MITSYTLFLESTFSTQSIFDKEFDYEEKYVDKVFIDDGDPITKVHIEKYDKDILLHWYNTQSHIIKDKIKNRTPINSITEFNEIVEKYIKILFDKHFKEFSTRMSSSVTNKVAIRMPELDAFIIIQYEPDQIFDDFTVLNMITIAPLLRRVAAINRIFYL